MRFPIINFENSKCNPRINVKFSEGFARVIRGLNYFDCFVSRHFGLPVKAKIIQQFAGEKK